MRFKITCGVFGVNFPYYNLMTRKSKKHKECDKGGQQKSRRHHTRPTTLIAQLVIYLERGFRNS